MNVMLTCAGRRNYLVKAFQEALRGHGQVFAADSCADAPALRQADGCFILPPLDDPSYITALLAICQLNRIVLLVPLNDLELRLLASYRTRFLEIGTIPLISSPEVIDKCVDKWATFNFLRASKIETPQTYHSLVEAREALNRRDIFFPLVVKPRWGTASIGIEYSFDDEELDLHYTLTKKYLPRTFLREISATEPDKSILIQKRMCGQEYGLDIVNDLDGHYVCTLVKRKIAMRAGETDKAITVKSSWLEGIGEAIGRNLGHIGVLDCDAIVSEDRCYVLDLNPRFSGCYPFSQIAGANLPAAFVAWANSKQPDARWLRVEPDIVASKYEEVVVVQKNEPLTRRAVDQPDSLKNEPVVLST